MSPIQVNIRLGCPSVVIKHQHTVPNYTPRLKHEKKQLGGDPALPTIVIPATTNDDCNIDLFLSEVYTRILRICYTLDGVSYIKSEQFFKIVFQIFADHSFIILNKFKIYIYTAVQNPMINHLSWFGYLVYLYLYIHTDTHAFS